MIERVCLRNVNLKAFVEMPPAGAASEVWCCEVQFHKGASYLVEAGSGRGKSSLCAFLYGLRKDFIGDIEFCYNNGNVSSIRECDFVKVRQRSLSMMFQEHRLFPELTAVENVLLKSRLTEYANEKEVRDMLERVGLAGRLDSPCGQLSLGQQQRVAFVRALCQPADFIFLDEPVSHIDEVNALTMAQMLKERQQKDGVGVIVTSIGYRLPYDYDNVLKL